MVNKMQNTTTNEIFKNREYMTPEQLAVAEEFEQMVVKEYQLCIANMRKANELANLESTSTESDTRMSINCAGLEIDAIREYWLNRFVAIVQTIEHRNPDLERKLRQSYL
jgi:hypothetical protein